MVFRLSDCSDFSSKILEAYKFKRGIDDKFIEKFFYTTIKETEDLDYFFSVWALRDKEGNVALAECVPNKRDIKNV